MTAQQRAAAHCLHLSPPFQGITTAIAFQAGFGSSAFAVAVAFSSIVMYDAAGVRRHAGAGHARGFDARMVCGWRMQAHWRARAPAAAPCSPIARSCRPSSIARRMRAPGPTTPYPGKQAEVLNQVVDELLEGHPVSSVKLKEVLGHTPLQVKS